MTVEMACSLERRRPEGAGSEAKNAAGWACATSDTDYCRTHLGERSGRRHRTAQPGQDAADVKTKEISLRRSEEASNQDKSSA